MSYVKVGKRSYDITPVIYPMVNKEELMSVLLNGREEEQALIMELFLKYGLRVIHCMKAKSVADENLENSTVYVLEKNGVVIGRAWVADVVSRMNGNSTLKYHFRTPLYRKDRGHNRNIWTSAALKALIKTINFLNCGESMEKAFTSATVKDALGAATRDMGVDAKATPWKNEISRYSISVETYTALVRMFGGMNKEDMPPNVIKELTEAHTKVLANDYMTTQFNQQVMSAFRDEFYIAFQYPNYFSLGKMKVLPDGAVEEMRGEFPLKLDMNGWAHGAGCDMGVLTKPMTLHSSLDEIVDSDPAFVTAVTMARAYLGVAVDNILLPVSDTHYPTAGVSTYYARHISADRPMCVIVPAYVPMESHA